MIASQRYAEALSIRPLAALTLSSLLVAACVATPNDVAQLDADHALSQRSERGLVEATVSLESPEIERGPNDFSIMLHAASSNALPVLVSVEASMAAHGHHASASSILGDRERSAPSVSICS